MSSLLDDIAGNVAKQLGNRLKKQLAVATLASQNFYHHRAKHVCHITCYSKDLSRAWMALLYFENELLQQLADNFMPGLDITDNETKEDVLTEISNQLAGTFALVFREYGYEETDISIPNIIQPTREVKLATLQENNFTTYHVGEEPASLEIVLTEYDTINFD